MHRTAALLALVAVAAACADAPATAPASASLVAGTGEQTVGGVFALTNDVAGNGVMAFARAADGSLRPLGTFASGGKGTGGTTDPLVSQFALILNRSAQRLYVVDAGTDEVTTFAVRKDGLDRLATITSGGDLPTSLAASARVLYVMNAGSNTIAAFALGSNGVPAAQPFSVQPLSSSALGAAAIRLTPGAHALVVTERQSQTIDVLPIEPDGSLGAPVQSPSAGAGPFGFDITPTGTVVVSEAAGGSASSYSVGADGLLTVVSRMAMTTERAPCWLIVTPDGRFAYTANAGSGTLSGFAVASNGSLSLLDADGITGNTGAGSTPLDLDTSRDGKYVYVLEAGTGTIGAFAVRPDGGLTELPDTPSQAARTGQMGLAAY
jgi:6-phosphogluconolactonase (cycloisomerase 2 family)